MSARRGHKRKVARQLLPAGVALLLLAFCCSCASLTTSPSSPAPPQAKETPAQAASGQKVASQFRPTSAGCVQTFSARDRGTDAFESFINFSPERQFETRTIEKQLTRTKFAIKADYPQLVGDRSAAARKFNQAAETLVDGDIEPYLTDKRDLEKERREHWKDVEEYHTISHKVIFASDEVISVLFYAYGYSWGAAHGYHYPLVLNYDLQRGRVLKLADLFPPGSKYLQTIADYCLRDLSCQLGITPQEVQGWSGGAMPTPKNYQAWVLTPKGLVIIFEEYQVTSYAGGEPKVLIPYERLRDIINPRGVLASLAISGQ
ncbi:MAG TPA: DUF3298 domain-containing protein [Pyrinomonadaceae bacterium]|jgi:hypothetical protein